MMHLSKDLEGGTVFCGAVIKSYRLVTIKLRDVTCKRCNNSYEKACAKAWKTPLPGQYK